MGCSGWGEVVVGGASGVPDRLFGLPRYHNTEGLVFGGANFPAPPPPHPALGLTGRNAAEVTDGSAAGTLLTLHRFYGFFLFQRLKQLSKNRKGGKKTSSPYLPGRLQVDTQPGVATQTGRTCSKSQRLFPTTLPQPRNIFRDSI